MIACVAKTVSQPESRIAIIEAGTGTGKTAGYCLASIPIALSQGKRLIISTATVALQMARLRVFLRAAAPRAQADPPPSVAR